MTEVTLVELDGKEWTLLVDHPWVSTIVCWLPALSEATAENFGDFDYVFIPTTDEARFERATDGKFYRAPVKQLNWGKPPPSE